MLPAPPLFFFFFRKKKRVPSEIIFILLLFVLLERKKRKRKSKKSLEPTFPPSTRTNQTHHAAPGGVFSAPRRGRRTGEELRAGERERKWKENEKAATIDGAD